MINVVCKKKKKLLREYSKVYFYSKNINVFFYANHFIFVPIYNSIHYCPDYNNTLKCSYELKKCK